MSTRGPAFVRGRHAVPWWEASFHELDTSTFGDPGREYVSLLPRLPPGARVLDIGCGDGRNALLFAAHGHRVTAMDVSAAGIDKLRHRAARAGVRVDARVGDMRELRLDRDYELVIAHAVLQLVEPEHWRRIIRDCRQHTVAGGWNAVTVLTDERPPPADLAPFCLGLFPPGELARQYADWHLETACRYVKRDDRSGKRRRLPLEKVIARRPGT